MIKLLPFIIIPVLLVGGFFYLKVQSSGQTQEEDLSGPRDIENPIEVPKTLPKDASLEQRVSALEDDLGSISIVQSPQTESNNSLDSRVGDLEASITELKIKVSNLENATPAPQSSSKSTVYIPLGSGGYWGNKDWYTLAEYEISLNPGNYPGYSGMVLEVTFRLVEASGTGYVRLYNITDNLATSGEVTTTSTTHGLKTSSSFTLPSGAKTYKLQMKSTEGKDLYIQSARIKVNF